MLSCKGLFPGIAASLLLVSGTSNSCNSSNTQIGPSGGEVAGAIVGVSAVIVGGIVLVEVHHSHHTLKGCVSSTPDGLSIIDSNGRSYVVTGNSGGLKVGDQVRLHGSKEKQKGTTERSFVVEKISKDYGPCKNAASAAAANP